MDANVAKCVVVVIVRMWNKRCELAQIFWYLIQAETNIKNQILNYYQEFRRERVLLVLLWEKIFKFFIVLWFGDWVCCSTFIFLIKIRINLINYRLLFVQSMWKFRNDDYVFYALKAKPIAKRSKNAKKVVHKVQNNEEAYVVHQSRVKVQKDCLKEVDTVNISSFSSIKLKDFSLNHQKSLAAMQKAVKQQQAMYNKYCYLGKALQVHDSQGLLQQFSQIDQEQSVVKMSSPANYFSSLLQDPKDKENIFFLEHPTQASIEKQVERSQIVADYDVSAYFNV